MASRLNTLYRQYLQQTRAQNTFSLAISKRLTLLGTDDNLRKGSFEFMLHQSDCHAFSTAREGQTVHGGVLALVVQDATTLHILSNDVRGRKGVTTDLNLSYLGVGKVGRTLQIDSEILKVGATLGVAEAKVKDVSTDNVLAVGRHTIMFVGEDNSNLQFQASLSSVFDV